jgi:hypothetical protein
MILVNQQETAGERGRHMVEGFLGRNRSLRLEYLFPAENTTLTMVIKRPKIKYELFLSTTIAL